MSTLTISNLSDGTKTIATTNVTNGSAKAWAANAIHSNQATQDSFNQSSYTDTGLGRADISFTNSMDSAIYSVVCGAAAGAYPYQGYGIDATKYRLSTVNSSGNFSDGRNNGAVFGDLA